MNVIEVFARIEGVKTRLSGRQLSLREAVGEPTEARLEVVSPTPLEPRALLRRPASVHLQTSFGERRVAGLVLSASVMASSRKGLQKLELNIASTVALLAFRRRTRVFQHQSVPDIVRTVFEAAGLPSDALEFALGEAHVARDYLVQYAETDLAFVRRLCEDEGLHYRFEARDGFDALVLADTSGAAPCALGAPLVVVDKAGIEAPHAAAWSPQRSRRVRSSEVTVRDYDHEHPSVALESNAKVGADGERALEVYVAPASFRVPAEGKRRASLALEALRHDASILVLKTDAVEVAPGRLISLEADPALESLAEVQGDFFVVSVTHQWALADGRYDMNVSAVPRAISYRLPRITPKPHIAGVQTAFVTGPKGEEIHTDDGGRVTLHFPWDREGPRDHRSSRFVRVVQPNLPGSLLLPRIGWEALVAFEDGDPDRPFVLGRLNNARHLPPKSLPANKTMTVLATSSSPGAHAQSFMSYEDGAGKQHLAWNAPCGKSVTSAGPMTTQTIGNEAWTVGSQTVTVGANDKLSVGAGHVVKAASESLAIGGSHTVKVLGSVGLGAGSESVVIGGLLDEKIGDPVAGAIGLLKAAAVTGVSEIPVVGKFAGPALGAGIAAYDALQTGDAKDALVAAGKSVLQGIIDSKLPGADAMIAAAESTGLAPWLPKPKPPKKDTSGGGEAHAGASTAAAAAGSGAGHRIFDVKGAMTEIVAGASAFVSPGSVKATTFGLSTLIVGDNHNIRALKVSSRTAGALNSKSSSLNITTAVSTTHVAKAALKRSISGAMMLTGGEQLFGSAGPVTVTVRGSMTLDGGTVSFTCGSSTVSASPGGVLIKATKVTVNGKVIQPKEVDP